MNPLTFLLGIQGLALGLASAASAQPPSRADALRAAVHPVPDARTMQVWLSRVPVTRDFPGDFAATLQGHGSAFEIEMTTAPGCVPCGDLWRKLSTLAARYGWRVRVLDPQAAPTRSGRLGIPWIGHPVAWVRPLADEGRTIPIAVGTDHAPNLARNLYLAAKMLTGVRPAVGVRAMSKFTGIVGVPAATARRR